MLLSYRCIGQFYAIRLLSGPRSAVGSASDSRARVSGSIRGPSTYFVSSSSNSRRAVVSYWRKCVHEVLVNRSGGLNLPRKSVVRLTGRPDITPAVYRERKPTKLLSDIPGLDRKGILNEPFYKLNTCS